MAPDQFRADNHYVPSVYLKHFTDRDHRIWNYETLVSHHNIGLWRKRQTKAVGHLRHLYTRIAVGEETDEIEKWLGRDFEDPAEEALDRAISDQGLTAAHWRRLIRFSACQFVRTPAFFVKHLPMWKRDIPGILNSTLEKAKQDQLTLQSMLYRHADLLPFRAFTEAGQDGNGTVVKVEAAAGRGLWHFGIRHWLTKTLDTLEDQRWSIVKPYPGRAWFTSDDPVVAVRFHGDNTYDFGGGWKSDKAQIMLPISPSHLLYTVIGQKPLSRNDFLGPHRTELFRKLLAQHAYRAIYAAAQDEQVPIWRPRTEDASLYHAEREEWRKFPEEQANIERRYRSKKS